MNLSKHFFKSPITISAAYITYPSILHLTKNLPTPRAIAQNLPYLKINLS